MEQRHQPSIVVKTLLVIINNTTKNLKTAVTNEIECHRIKQHWKKNTKQIQTENK